MMLTRKSANYLRIFVVIIPLIWGCNTDTPRSSEEKKHIDKGSKVIQAEVGKYYIPEYVKELFEHPGFSRSLIYNPPSTAESTKVKNYTFKVTEKKGDEKVCMDIFRSGRKIRSDCANSMTSFAIVTRPDPGTDINGDGVPEVIVNEDTREWHCCDVYAIFSLGKSLKLITVLYGEHSYFDFKDLDNDGKYEAIGRDWNFAYWSTSFAGSPAPEVILRWKNGKYRLAEDLMKKPPPEKKELLEIASEFKKNAVFYGEIQKLHWEPEWWAVMIKLIYTGNGNLAWEFCDWFWPVPEEKSLGEKYFKEKKVFLGEFKKQLKKSYYWADLKKMNGW